MSGHYVDTDPAAGQRRHCIDLLNKKGGRKDAGAAGNHELDSFGETAKRHREDGRIRPRKAERHQDRLDPALLSLPAEFDLGVEAEQPLHLCCGLSTPEFVSDLREAPMKSQTHTCSRLI